MNSYSLWHITPADLGVQFVNFTSSALEANDSLYSVIHENRPIPNDLSKEDKECVRKMQNYFNGVKGALAQYEKSTGIPDGSLHGSCSEK